MILSVVPIVPVVTGERRPRSRSALGSLGFAATIVLSTWFFGLDGWVWALFEQEAFLWLGPEQLSSVQFIGMLWMEGLLIKCLAQAFSSCVCHYSVSYFLCVSHSEDE